MAELSSSRTVEIVGVQCRSRSAWIGSPAPERTHEDWRRPGGSGAEEHGIPIERDPDLLQCLAPLDIGGEIPVDAYRAVAEILACLYEKNSSSP